MNGNDQNNKQDVVEPKDNDQQQEQPKEEPKEGKTFTRDELASAVNAQVAKMKDEFKATLAEEVKKAR